MSNGPEKERPLNNHQEPPSLDEGSSKAEFSPPRRVEAVFKKHFGRRPTAEEIFAEYDSSPGFAAKLAQIGQEISDALKTNVEETSSEGLLSLDVVSGVDEAVLQGLRLEGESAEGERAEEELNPETFDTPVYYDLVPLVFDHSRDVRWQALDEHIEGLSTPADIWALQSQPLDGDDVEATLEKGSLLEAYAFIRSVESDSDQERQTVLDYVQRAADLMQVLDSPEAQHQRASAWLRRVLSTMCTVEELGSDVPVVLRQTIEEADSSIAEIASEIFGHPFEVMFYKGEGLWSVELTRELSQHPSLTGLLRKGFVTRGSTDLFGGEFFTTSFSALKGLVEVMRNEQLVELCKVDSVASRSFSSDTFASGRVDIQRLFINQQPEPIMIRNVATGSISRLQLLIPRLSSRSILEAQEPFLVVEDEGGNRIRWKISPRIKESPDAEGFARIGARVTEQGLRFVRIDFDGNRKLIVFERPLGLFADRSWLPNPAVISRKEKTFRIYGLQYVNSIHEWIPLVSPIQIVRSAPRFKQPPLSVDYFTAQNLEVGTPINRHRMTKALDPELQKLGLQLIKGRWNVETNFLDISIPLVKPTQLQFQKSALETIRALQVVPRGHWRDLVASVDGDFVLGIEEFVRSMGHASGAGSSMKSRDDEQSPKVDALGKFYKQPRLHVRMYGPWMLSTVKAHGEQFYIVDSCAYGDALYLFQSEEGAKRAAEHFQRFGLRGEARSFPGFVQRILHTERWRENLTQAIHRHILHTPYQDGVTRLFG